MAINLIPPHAKESIRYERYARRAMFAGELLFSALVLLALLLVGEVWFSDRKLAEVNTAINTISSRAEVQEVGRFQRELRDLNDDVERVSDLQRAHPETFEALREIIRTIAPLARLTEVSVDMDKRLLVVGGVAASRERLLALKDVLAAHPDYGTVDFPLSNLLKPGNIPFSLSIPMEDAH